MAHFVPNRCHTPKRCERQVARLQARIVKASQMGRWGKVKTLQRLLTCSFSGKALAVKRVLQLLGERLRGELAALVGVEDLRPAVGGQGLLDRVDAERGVHRDRQPPAQDLAAEPVHYRAQVAEAARHRDVGDIHRPDLVGPVDRISALLDL